jgi:hypothetical protein
MTTQPDPASPQLDLREQLIRIDRAMAESQKFQAEREKLLVQAAKLNRERWLTPVLAIAAVIGGLLGAASFIAKLIS